MVKQVIFLQWKRRAHTQTEIISFFLFYVFLVTILFFLLLLLFFARSFEIYCCCRCSGLIHRRLERPTTFGQKLFLHFFSFFLISSYISSSHSDRPLNFFNFISFVFFFFIFHNPKSPSLLFHCLLFGMMMAGESNRTSDEVESILKIQLHNRHHLDRFYFLFCPILRLLSSAVVRFIHKRMSLNWLDGDFKSSNTQRSRSAWFTLMTKLQTAEPCRLWN